MKVEYRKVNGPGFGTRARTYLVESGARVLEICELPPSSPAPGFGALGVVAVGRPATCGDAAVTCAYAEDQGARGWMCHCAEICEDEDRYRPPGVAAADVMETVELGAGEVLAVTRIGSGIGHRYIEPVIFGSDSDIARLNRDAGVKGLWYAAFGIGLRTPVFVDVFLDLVVADICGYTLHQLPDTGYWYALPYDRRREAAAYYARIVDGVVEVKAGWSYNTPCFKGEVEWSTPAFLMAEQGAVWPEMMEAIPVQQMLEQGSECSGAVESEEEAV